jgi:hypothetical protein
MTGTLVAHQRALKSHELECVSQLNKGVPMIQIPKAFRFLLLAVASASLLAACGGSDDDDLDDRADVADPKVRFVHAVPGGPNVTLQRNGAAETGATDVAYKYGSQYYDVSTENYTFSLRNAAGDVELATTTVNADRGNKYTLIALPTDSGAELVSIRDPYNKSVTSDDARVRLINAAVNAESFDVYLTPVGADLATATPRVTALGYKQVAPASGEDSFEIGAGEYQVRLTPTGSKTPFFDATVTAPADGDWLLVALPDETAANSVRFLLVRSDDTSDATDEIPAPAPAP